MKTATFRLLAILLSFVFILAAGGCSKKKKPDAAEGESSAAISETDISSGNADSDSGRAMGLQTVYYAYDSSLLSGEAKSVLNQNARILKENPSVKVQIEGHTDERGGIQYNIALGERRAKAARSYLIDKGISENRLSVISYGKEKPIDPGHDEDAWAKNRRANFRITEK